MRSSQKAHSTRNASLKALSPVSEITGTGWGSRPRTVQSFSTARYTANPLVFCGNVGLIPRNRCEKSVEPGDLVVAIGGQTGRDGIHGATFSSAELDDTSENLGSVVQIGNPIMEKKIVDALLQARDRNLYRSITDCGAGGFSSAVGEMGEPVGAEVHLERVSLKYEGLAPWEIWLSEAQERMVIAVPPENIP